MKSGEAVAYRGVAQLVSAPGWGSGGQRFESARPDFENLEGKNINSFTSHLFSFQTLGNKWDNN